MIDHLTKKYAYVTQHDYDNVKGEDWPSFFDFQQHVRVPSWVYEEVDSMLLRKEPFTHPSFCVLPWHGLELSHTNYETKCCLLEPNYDIEKIKKEMKEGIRSAECRKCWTLEDNNQISDRYLKNSSLDFYLNKDLADIMRDADREEILTLKVNTSYVCNGACVYCDSNASSYWNTIERRMDKTIPIKAYKFIDLDAVTRRVDFSKLTTLTLIGGEPFLERQNFQILEKMLDVGNDDVFISVVTNATVRLTDRYKDMLSRFKNLNLTVSIDCRGNAFNYQRWPLQWDDVVENLDQYRTVTDNISVSCTITNMTVMYYNDIAQWLQEQGLPWIPNPVYKPEVFHPSVLPVSAKQVLKDVLEPEHYRSFIGNPDQDPGDTWLKFLNEIDRQDRAKGIDIHDYLPEFCNLVGI